MRYDRHMTFQVATGPRGPAWGFVARAGPYTVTAGKASRERKRLRTHRLDPARVHQPPGRLVAILGPPDAGNEDRGGALNCECLMARGMA